MFALKSSYGDVGFRSVMAVDGNAMACAMQGPLNLQDIRPPEGRALELELPDRTSGWSSATEDPIGYRSYDAVDWESVDPLKRPNSRFGGAPIDTVYMKRKTMTA
jgi:hypothetical protein